MRLIIASLGILILAQQEVAGMKTELEWNWNEWKNKYYYKASKTGYPTCACITNDGYAIIGFSNGEIGICSNKTDNIELFDAHNHPVNHIQISSDNKLIFSACDKYIEIYKPKVSKYNPVLDNIKYANRKNYCVCKKPVKSMCTSPDPKHIIYSDGDGNVHIWDWKEESFESIIAYSKHTHITQDGSHLFVNNKVYNINTVLKCEDDFKPHIWKFTKRSIESCYGKDAWIYEAEDPKSICFCRKSNCVVFGYTDGLIEIWNWKENKCIKTFKDSESIDCGLFVTTDDKYIVYGTKKKFDSKNQGIKIIDMATGKNIKKVECQLSFLNMSHNGRYLVALEDNKWNRKIKIYDILKQK